MKTPNLRLFLAATTVNLVSFMAGLSYGWSSPVLPKLKSDINPLGRPITSFEEAWITSLLSLGASIGPIVCGLMVDKMGRKKTIFVTSLPIPVAYLVLAFTSRVELYFFSRFILGLGIGSAYSIIPMYVGEIAEDENRGFLGCLMNLLACLGALSGFAIGPYVSVKSFCLIALIPLVVCYILFPLTVVESPYYLTLVGKDSEAVNSLRKLHKSGAEKEMLEIKRNVEENFKDNKTSNIFKLFQENLAIRKGLLIGGFSMFFQQFSGICVIISYMQPIFEASGAQLSPEISTIIIGLLQVLVSLITSQLIDRLGRKVLLFTSYLGLFVSNLSLGLYFFLKNFDADLVGALNFLPITSLLVFVVTFSVGVGPVSFALLGELFPPNVRSTATCFSSVICLFSAFILTVFFPNLVEIVGMAWTFWIFATFSLGGVGFVWWWLPETKGKSLEEIQAILGQTNK